MKILFVLLVLTAQARAYVTSAILEYTCDDKAGFYLNGSTVLERSPFAPFDYCVLSTSDGTLPMEFFNNYGDNVLGVVNYDTKGGNMQISYRFTVHQSDGDPIVIWSMPEQAKMLHLHKPEQPPADWMRPDFNDSAWLPAVAVTSVIGVYTAIPRLVDPTFAGFLGIDPFVPILGNVFNASCATGDHNHFRSHFRFPDKPAKVQALVNTPKAKAGDKIGVRLIPGPDTSEYSQFNVLAWVPQGLELIEASKGGQYDSKLHRIAWNFGAKDLDVRYAKMGAATVFKSGGWANINSVLGKEKQGKLREQLNTPQYLWDEGATMSPNRPTWFKMEPHGVVLTAGRPVIKGVIFHTQLRLGGTDTANVRETDFIRLNYSVDGRAEGAMANDVIVSRMSASSYWFDGYYDATEDRKWTWEDLDRLMVKMEARPKGSPDKNIVASIVASVKYFNPSKASPYFYAKVVEPQCKVLQLATGIYRVGSPLNTSDPIDLRVNDYACAPTPIPTPTFTPIPKEIMRAPTPQPKATPDTGAIMVGDIRFHLSCLAANPEPFNFGGTFVGFCLKKEADITLNVYSGLDSRLVRQMKAGNFRAGDSQFFFNALSDAGTLLRPGPYVFELIAEKNGHKETRNGTFNMVKGKGR